MILADSQLKADLRFPRLNREIATKLIRACRRGRFGWLFQQQVEQERTRSGGMPNGRCMLRTIFRQFQFERDHIGMLAERNLLNTRLAGGSLQDLEGFRDKYLYVLTTIPDADLPKPSTMFNHLIDELDTCPTLKQKVEKARESRPGSQYHVVVVESCGHCALNFTNRKALIHLLLPALTDPNVPAAPATREKKKKKKKKKKKEDPEVLPRRARERAKVIQPQGALRVGADGWQRRHYSSFWTGASRKSDDKRKRQRRRAGLMFFVRVRPPSASSCMTIPISIRALLLDHLPPQRLMQRLNQSQSLSPSPKLKPPSLP